MDKTNDPVKFHKGDLEFIRDNYPDIYSKIEPIVCSDMITVRSYTDEDWVKLQDILTDGLLDPISIDGMELTKKGLKLEWIIDELLINN